MSNSKARKQLSRLYGVLTPACSGKTTLWTKLTEDTTHNKDSKPVVVIDIDKVDNDNTNEDAVVGSSFSQEDDFLALQKIVYGELTTHSKKNVLVLSSSPELLEFLKVPKKQTYVFVQSQILFLKGIAGLLNSLKGAGKGEASSQARTPVSRRPQGRGAKPLHLQGAAASEGSAGELQSLNNYVVTANNDEDDTPEISFGEEIDHVCRTRDRLMVDFSKEYTMYNSFEELYKFVSEKFGLVTKS